MAWSELDPRLRRTPRRHHSRRSGRVIRVDAALDWAVSHPKGDYGITHLDFYTVETLGEAGITAAIGLLLIPGVLLLARWWSATHVAPAVRMLAASDSSDGP